VSADRAPREVFRRQLDGAYAVFELEATGANLRVVFSKYGTSPYRRAPLGMCKPTLHLGEWTTLASVDTIPREIFRRPPDGIYEVFEETDIQYHWFVLVHSALRSLKYFLPNTHS
jgi:hypothetical protein